ncbi:FKBP-type peptidyl-prolyl cis-trans isomerase [Actinomycetota bacterium Odt1-20B]
MHPTSVVRTGAALALAAVAAAACAAPKPQNIPEVTGAPGTRPTITIPDRPAPKDARVKVLREGTGAAVKKGQVAVTDVEMKIWEGKKKLMSSWGLTQPTTVSFDGEHVSRTWDQALIGREGGSRVLMVTPATSGFGPNGMAPAQVRPSDHMVLVFDLIGGYDIDQRVAASNGGATGAPEGAPTVDFPAGKLARVSWAGAAKPQKLHVRTVTEGKGPVVRDGDVAVVQYSGWEWGKAKPFRYTYGVTGPNGMVVKKEAMLPGMYEALKGVRVGSRLQISVPANYVPGFKMTRGGLVQPPGASVMYMVDVLDRQDR